MGKNLLTFLGMLVLIALVGYVAYNGLPISSKIEIKPAREGIKQGLDLRGGSVLTYEPDANELTADEIKEKMQTAVGLLRTRLDNLGYTEANLSQVGGSRIRVEIPAVTDIKKASETIGSTAKLSFRTSDGKNWVAGDAVKSAKAAYGPTEENDQTSNHYVAIEFNPEAAQAFADASKFAANQSEGKNTLETTLDGKVVETATVRSKYASQGITGGSCVITFGKNKEAQTKAKEFASLVQAGALPFALKEVSASVVGPTLGQNALQKSLLAGFIGVALIILFMLVIYRLPGLVASIALALYTGMIVVLLSVLGVNLTLPGIAGIVLSIGMAVDANVLIYERLKEELRAGKTIGSAVDASFKRALPAILDSNITTIIVAVVLKLFGSGPIVGFANTLLIGLLLSLFTVLVVSQFLLRQLINLGVTNLALYGVNKNAKPTEERTFSFIKNFRKFAIPSLIVAAVAVISLGSMVGGARPYNLDIDFAGGTVFQYDLKKDVADSDLNLLKDAVQEISGQEPNAPQTATNKDGAKTNITIKTVAQVDAAGQEEILKKLQATYPDTTVENYESVGGSVGADLRNAAIKSIIVALILMLIYVGFRFQFASGLAAVLALGNDVCFAIVAYLVLQIPVNMDFIAVLLTVVGYSINSTVILFDRVRENRRLMQKSDFAEIADRSIWQTIVRNINTTLAVLFPLALLIILGVQSVREFAIPLTIGVIVGAFSSICLSAPLWHIIRKADNKAAARIKAKG